MNAVHLLIFFRNVSQTLDKNEMTLKQNDPSGDIPITPTNMWL